MLNGIAPILLVNLKKKIEGLDLGTSQIPIISELSDSVSLPPIPIYFSEELTGIYIDSENKNVDIDTSIETLSNGEDPQTNQKSLNSTVTINAFATRGSIGLNILSALIDVIFKRVTSKEYSITYIHGPITIFNGLVHQFSVNQDPNSTLLTMQLILTAGTGKTIVEAVPPTVTKTTGALPL